MVSGAEPSYIRCRLRTMSLGMAAMNKEGYGKDTGNSAWHAPWRSGDALFRLQAPELGLPVAWHCCRDHDQ